MKVQMRSRYIALLFLQPRRYMWMGGQRHAPAGLIQGKTWNPLYRRLGGPQGRSGRVPKILPLPGFDPRAVQPVASRYTDWAIAAAEGRTELPTISVYLFAVLDCVTHIALPTQLEGLSYNKLNPNCLYAGTKQREMFFLLFLDVFVSYFLAIHLFFSNFLTVRLLCVTWPSCSFQ